LICAHAVSVSLFLKVRHDSSIGAQKSFRQGVNEPKIPAGKKFAALMDDFSPSAVVVQKEFVESKKKATMWNALVKQADKHRIPMRFLTRRAVRSAFVGSNRNKYAVAAALVKQLPELAPRLPGVPKIWKSEDYRMSIFDAAALGVAYFRHRRTPLSPAGVQQDSYAS